AREQIANRQSQLDRNQAIEARRQAIEQRDHSRQQSADLALDKGIALAQEGHADRALLWMLEALKTAPEPAKEFRKLVRWNLGAWLGQVHKTLRVIETSDPCSHIAFSPDGRSFAIGFTPVDFSLANPLSLWDTASGQKLVVLPGAFAPFAFRGDGKVLVARDDYGHAVAIDLVTKQALWTSPQLPAEYWETIEFSRDTKTIFVTVSESRNRVSIWRLNAATGRQVTLPIRSTGWAAVAPDATAVAIRRVDDGKAYIDVLDMASLSR